MSDPYYEMIEREMKLHPKWNPERVRIMVNDRFAKSGYIPVPPDDSPCLDGRKRQRGKRCDADGSTDQYGNPIYFRQPIDNSERNFLERIRQEEAESYARAEKSRLLEEVRWARRSIRAPKASSR